MRVPLPEPSHEKTKPKGPLDQTGKALLTLTLGSNTISGRGSLENVRTLSNSNWKLVHCSAESDEIARLRPYIARNKRDWDEEEGMDGHKDRYGNGKRPRHEY
jgi:hypothetical protein